MGRSNFALCLRLDPKAGRFTVFLNLGGDDARANLYLLKRDAAAIAKDLGEVPVWEDKTDNKEKKVLVEFGILCPDRADWPKVYAWAQERLETFQRTFRPRVAALNAASWDGITT